MTELLADRESIACWRVVPSPLGRAVGASTQEHGVSFLAAFQGMVESTASLVLSGLEMSLVLQA